MSVMQQKELTESKSILDMPIAELAKLCRNPQILLTALNLARQQGYKAAHEQAHRFYHMLFTGHNETSIRN